MKSTSIQHQGSGCILAPNGGLRHYGSDMLQLNIGREFVHSSHRMKFGYAYNSSNSEYAAYQYSINFARSHILSVVGFYIKEQAKFEYNSAYK